MLLSGRYAFFSSKSCCIDISHSGLPDGFVSHFILRACCCPAGLGREGRHCIGDANLFLLPLGGVEEEARPPLLLVLVLATCPPWRWRHGPWRGWRWPRRRLVVGWWPWSRFYFSCIFFEVYFSCIYGIPCYIKGGVVKT
jgi:hypothetical protein